MLSYIYPLLSIFAHFKNLFAYSQLVILYFRYSCKIFPLKRYHFYTQETFYGQNVKCCISMYNSIDIHHFTSYSYHSYITIFSQFERWNLERFTFYEYCWPYFAHSNWYNRIKFRCDQTCNSKSNFQHINAIYFCFDLLCFNLNKYCRFLFHYFENGIKREVSN